MYKSRRETVKEILTSKPFTSLKELEERFPELSSMTLRRDIEYFESRGDVIKVRGGARSMKHITSTLDDPFARRSAKNVSIKQRIASEAIKHMESGRSVFFDSGTTMLEMIPFIGKDRYNIVTSGPNVALELLRHENVMVNIVGGMLNKNNISASGAEANNYIEHINIDIAFISPSGFSLKNGFTSGNWNESELKRLVVERAEKVIVLLSSDKIDRSMPYTFGHLEDIDLIITEENPPKELCDAAKKAGVKIIVVA